MGENGRKIVVDGIQGFQGERGIKDLVKGPRGRLGPKGN